MASQWYCRVGEQEYGPYTSPQLKQMGRDRQLLPEHQVRQGAEGRWILASQVQGLFAAASPKPLKQAEPLATRVSNSSLGESISLQVRAVVSPDAARPAPPRGPVATPVGVTPVVPTGAIPMGIPVGAVPVGIPVEPPYDGGFPVGVVPAGFPVVSTAAPAASSYESSDLPVGKKKNQTALYATIGMAACLVILVGVGGAVGLGFFKSKPAEKKELAAADTGNKEQEPEESFEPERASDAKAKSANAAAVAKQESSAATPETEAKADRAGKPTADQDKVVRAVRQFRDISTVKLVKLGNVQIQIAGVWFDSDAAPGESSDGAAKAPAKPKHVFIELSLANLKGPGILSYKSWNGAGKKPQEVAAILLDSEGNVCPLVDLDKVSANGRKQTADVSVGESLSDVLVFEAPQGEFNHLKLVLPYAAIGRDGGLGFQIPRDKVALSKSALAAATAPTAPGTAAVGHKPAAAEDTGGQPATISELNGVINKPPTKKPVDPDAPPSPKEIDRQLQDAKKLEAQQKAAEQKAAEDKPAGNKTP